MRPAPVFAALLAAVSVACGGNAPVASPTPSEPPTTQPPASDQPLPPGGRLVLPQPGQADLHPIGWETADVADDDVTITVTWWSGVEPCSVFDHAEVVEGDDAVVVTLFEGSDPVAGNGVCVAMAEQRATRIVLSSPLAGRVIVDGAAPG